MAEAFNSLQNHTVSDSSAAIKAGDRLSVLDGSDSLLGTNGPSSAVTGELRRRRGEEDEEENDLYDDDDMESLISQPLNGERGHRDAKPEEEVELPPHACAYAAFTLCQMVKCD